MQREHNWRIVDITNFLDDMWWYCSLLLIYDGRIVNDVVCCSLM